MGEIDAPPTWVLYGKYLFKILTSVFFKLYF